MFLKKHFAILFGVLAILTTQSLQANEAREIVRAAIDYWRGTSSVGEMTMTIHRPESRYPAFLIPPRYFRIIRIGLGFGPQNLGFCHEVLSW